MSKEEQIQKYMVSLGLSREDAEQLWEDDQADYIGEEGDTVYAEGKKIDRSVNAKGTQRAQAVFDELVAAAEELLRLVRKRRSMTNKDNAKLTSAIRALIWAWPLK